MAVEYLNDQQIWCRARFVTAARDRDGSAVRVLWLIESIDEEKSQCDKLKALSETDSMTGVRSKHAWLLKEKELMIALHDRSAEHITTGGAVVSGGLSVFRPGEDQNTHDVFQRADERMYEEKNLLKSLGAVTRDDESDKAQEAEVNAQQTIVKVKRRVLIVDDEFINRELLGRALSSGYEVIFAATAMRRWSRFVPTRTIWP